MTGLSDFGFAIDRERLCNFIIKMSEQKSEQKSEQNLPIELNNFTEEEIRLIQWEEWALSMEEHFHATEMYNRNPNGLPMGHR